jgi:hypothetical protein
MRLSEKDKEFLERLRELVEADEVWIERTLDRPSRFVLRGNYGSKVEDKFGISRQGVRWRFQRLFNDLYVDSFAVLLFIEKQLGAQFRQDALIIAHERFLLRQKAMQDQSFKEANSYRGKDQD